MKPHEIVSTYRGNPKYSEICRRARDLRQEGRGIEETLHTIETEYGIVTQKLEMREHIAPHFVLGEDIEPGALNQLYTTLLLPVAVQGGILPDGHVGYALPIGGVVALFRAIAPNLVGVDIGCRMHCTTFSGVKEHDVRDNLFQWSEALKETTTFGNILPEDTVADHPILHDLRWNTNPFMKSLQNLAAKQLGTSGSGNHFANIVTGQWLGSGESFVALLTHSGSRGPGAKIANYYSKHAETETRNIAKGIPDGYGWLPLNSDLGQQYLMAMQLMGDYAQANHEVIHARFAQYLGLKTGMVIQNHHNYAWVQDDGTVVHRKGATPAEKGIMGIIPGSMGTHSYIVEGLGNSDHMSTCSHGAGRRGSRTWAKSTFQQDEVEQYLAEKEVHVVGLSLDECPFAYKDIEKVIQLQVEAGVIKPVAQMSNIIVRMAGGK